MYRILFGSEKVGIQGIYYFDNMDSAKSFASKIKPYLDSLRNGTDYWAAVLNEWINDKMLYNFLLELKKRVGLEKDSPEIWWEPGGSLYGEKWKSEELPNGKFNEYIGENIIENENEVEKETQDGIVCSKLCLYKLLNFHVISVEEYDNFLKRIDEKEKEESNEN